MLPNDENASTRPCKETTKPASSATKQMVRLPCEVLLIEPVSRDDAPVQRERQERGACANGLGLEAHGLDQIPDFRPEVRLHVQREDLDEPRDDQADFLGREAQRREKVDPFLHGVHAVVEHLGVLDDGRGHLRMRHAQPPEKVHPRLDGRLGVREQLRTPVLPRFVVQKFLVQQCTNFE